MEGLSSVNRALDVLFHLHTEGRARGVSEIGRALDLPKASTHRLLRTLGRRALVEQDDRGRYRLGPGLLTLGLAAVEREPLVSAARSVLEAEANALNETVFVVAARGGALTVLDKAEGSGFLRASPRVGSTVPVHATAVGKLYFTFAPTQVELGDLSRFTDRTIETRAALQRAAKTTRTRGYALNDEEWINGLSVVAAPVLVRNQLRGAIAVAAATVRMHALGTDRVARRCVAAARSVADTLEGKQP
jgi:IclR family acetate operon transcriptional repressor